MKQETATAVRPSGKPRAGTRVQPARYGVCLFDDPQRPVGGTTCLDGETGRIERISELDTAVIWWTNIPYSVFSRQRLYRLPNLRSDQLLRVPYHSLMAELGLANEPPMVVAPILERLISRITGYLADAYGISGRGMVRLDWELKKRVHKRGRVLHGPLAGLRSAAADAHSYVHSAVSRTPGSSEVRTYLLPRTTHVRALFDLPYPDPRGDWESVQFQTPRRIEPDHLPSPLTLDRPAFVSINIRNGDPDFFTFTPFTRLAGRSTQMRTWATLAEALMYAEYGEVEVSRAWIGRFAPLQPLLQPPSQEFDFSFSASLVAEALFFALGALAKPEESNGLEPVAAYLLSYDRLFTQRAARTFYENGFHPMSHGSMRVAVAAHFADMEEVDELAVSLGLEPPVYSMDEVY